MIMSTLMFLLSQDKNASNSSSDSEDDQQTLPTFEVDCFEECLNSAPANPPLVPYLSEHNEEHNVEEHEQNEEFIVEKLDCNVEQNVQRIEEHTSENESSGRLFQPILHLNKWICVILIKVIKVKYKLSDSFITTLLSILQMIFTLISHPLRYCFPKTVQNLFVCAGVNQDSELKRYAVCPSPKCCNLYDCTLLSEATNIPLCARQIYSSRCREQLCYEKFLSFGKSRLVPYKTFIYLPPVNWLKIFIAPMHLKSFLIFN